MRVVRCFAFLDLRGFTAYTEEQGDARAVEVLAQLRAILRTEAEDKGVRVTKWLGDGVMLSPLATADTATFAPPDLQTRPLHEIRVPGLSAPVPLCELTPPVREQTDPPPSGIVGP